MSSITEQLQGPGAWTITLRPDTPPSLTTQLGVSQQAYGHIFILPGRLPIDTIDTATLLDLSIYTGIYRGRRSRFELRGAGPAIWLGDEQGKGDVPLTAVAGDVSLSLWITALAPDAVTIGTVTSPGGTLNWSTIDEDPRTTITFVCDHFGVEWRVGHDLVLDVGTVSDLYGWVPPAIITPWWDGQEDSTRAIRAVIEPDREAESYATGVAARGSGGGVGTASGPDLFYDIHGNDVVRRKVVSGGSATGSWLTAIAAGQLARDGAPKRQVSVSTDAWAVTTDCPVGSPVLLYDPGEGLYDLTNEFAFRGQLTWPLVSRLVRATWPVRDGMMVVFRKSDGTGELLDLTPYVEWSDGAARLELDNPPRSLASAVKRRGIRG